MRLLIRLIVNAAALWAATQVVTGVTYHGDVLPFLGVALVFGVVNTLIRPILKLFTFPLIVLTIGVFVLVINALMLWLTSSISSALGLGFHVTGFGAAFWGGLVVSLVSLALNFFMRERDDRNA